MRVSRSVHDEGSGAVVSGDHWDGAVGRVGELRSNGRPRDSIGCPGRAALIGPGSRVPQAVNPPGCAAWPPGSARTSQFKPLSCSPGYRLLYCPSISSELTPAMSQWSHCHIPPLLCPPLLNLLWGSFSLFTFVWFYVSADVAAATVFASPRAPLHCHVERAGTAVHSTRGAARRVAGSATATAPHYAVARPGRDPLLPTAGTDAAQPHPPPEAQSAPS